MCQTDKIDIPINDLTKCITVNVCITGNKTWAIKLRVGKALIKLAACIMGMNVEISVNE